MYHVIDYWAFDADFLPTIDNKPFTIKKNKIGLAVGIAVGAGVLGFLFILMILHVIRRKKKSNADDNEG